MNPDRKSIIRVFPQSTSHTPDDELVFIGDPPPSSSIPDADEVHVSVTFTWDMQNGERLRRAWLDITRLPTKIGGPAFGSPAGEFTPGMYVKRGVTITTRGCPEKCSYCFVPAREGSLKTLNIQPGNIVQDNNLLAAPRPHIKRVFEMLRDQKRAAEFTGGIDARRVDEWVAAELKLLRISQLFLAYDKPSQLQHLRKASKLLSFLPRRKLRCYVLVGKRGDTIENAEARCQEAWKAGTLPFAMFYRDDFSPRQSGEWNKFIRQWTRPAAMFTHMKELSCVI